MGRVTAAQQVQPQLHILVTTLHLPNLGYNLFHNNAPKLPLTREAAKGMTSVRMIILILKSQRNEKENEKLSASNVM